MTLAKERDVDMVLLAGDLFHDNSIPCRKVKLGNRLTKSRTFTSGHVPGHAFSSEKLLRREAL